MGEHVGSHVATEGKYRREVHLQDLRPVFVRELVRGMTALETGTVQKDANLMPISYNVRNEAFHGFLGREVCGVDGGFSAEGFDGFFSYRT